MIAYTDGLTGVSIVAAIENYELICKNAKTCYEVLSPLRNVYFDFDRQAQYQSIEEFEKFDSCLIEDIKKQLLQLLPQYELLSLTTSSSFTYRDTYSKHSFHVVLNTVKNFKECREIAEYVNEKGPLSYDLSVYKEVQLFRSTYCSKAEELRYKKILIGSFFDSIISKGSLCSPKLIDRFWRLPNIYKSAEDYDDWVKHGFLLASMAKYFVVHPIDAYLAFESFSMSASDHDEPSVLRTKFNDLVRCCKERLYQQLERPSQTFFETQDSYLPERPNTFAEYLSQQILIKNAQYLPQLLERLIAIVGEIELVPYYMLFHSSTLEEFEYYKLLYAIQKDVTSCFNFQSFLQIEYFNIISKLIKCPQQWCAKNFKLVNHLNALRVRNVLLEYYKEPIPNLIIPCTDTCTVDIWKLLCTIATANEEDILWSVQLPYYKSLKELWEMSGQSIKMFIFYVNRAANKIFMLEPYFHFFSYVNSDLNAAQTIYEMYPYWRLSQSKELFVFNDTTGLWTKEKHVQVTMIQRISKLISKPCKLQLVSRCENYGDFNTLCDKALIRLTSLQIVCDLQKEFDELKNSSIGKLLFPNGYYDGPRKTFIPAFYLSKNHIFEHDLYLFVHPELYFFARIPDNYVMRQNEEINLEKQRMTDILFYRMHGQEIGNYHLESLALALFGEKHKGFYVHVGDTNSGKSTEKALIEASFGDYCGTGVTDDFGIIKNDQREAVLINAFVVDNWYKRAVFYSEKGQRVLNTEMLKSLSSGGEDMIRSRKQYGTPALYQVHFKMFFYVNEGLVVNNPNDLAYIDRARYFYWTKSFVPPEEIVDPDIQLPRLKEVQEWKLSSCRRQLFVQIIIDAYARYIDRKSLLPIPEAVKLSTREEVGHALSIDEMIEKLMYGFIFSGNPESFVDRDTIERVCEQLGLSSKKIRINSFMHKIGFTTIHTKQKKIRGQKQNVWVGMELRHVAPNMVDETFAFVNFENWLSVFKKFNGHIPQNVINNVCHYQNLDSDSEFYEYLSDAQKNVIESRKRRRLN